MQRHYFANKGPSSQSYGFSNSHVWMWELDCEESWAPKNWCSWTGVGEDSWESLGLQGDQISQSWRKLTLNTHWKDWCWIWVSNNLATRCKEPIHWKRPWGWERLRAEEGNDRGWDGWMAITDSMYMSLSNFQEMVKDREAWHAACSPWGHKDWVNNNKWLIQFSV